MIMLPTLRTKKTEDKYNKFRKTADLKKCPLCDIKPTKVFKYWKIIKNDFPYDRIAKNHDLLVPKRHEVENNLTKKEMKELKSIKNIYINKSKKYTYIMEVTKMNKTIPSHFHLHLIKLK